MSAALLWIKFMINFTPYTIFVLFKITQCLLYLLFPLQIVVLYCIQVLLLKCYIYIYIYITPIKHKMGLEPIQKNIIKNKTRGILVIKYSSRTKRHF